MQIDVVNSAEREGRLARPERRGVRRPRQDRSDSRVGRARQRGRASRHARDEDPRDGQRHAARSRGGRRAPAARASARSAIRCGARAARSFGPQPRSYDYQLPKKVEKGALRAALTQKLRDGEVIVVDALSVGEIKTKAAAEMLRAARRRRQGAARRREARRQAGAVGAQHRGRAAAAEQPHQRARRDEHAPVVLTRAALEKLQEALG